MVGRITPWKGQLIALRAFADVRHTHADLDLTLVFAGGTFFEGDQDYLDELRAETVRLGLSSSVQFLGHKSDTRSIYNSLDLLIHSSLRPEPFGQVVVEAMSYGLLVAASNAGGVREIIQNGVTGALYEPGSVEQLTASLSTLITLPVEANISMRLAAQRRSSDFQAGEIMPRMREILEKYPH
jgi:glycosyltransferase involved in cell wall biosynthesis